jgi:hypothetical protein
MTPELYRHYPVVDSAVGTRILLAFSVAERALEQRLRPPWQLAPLPAFAALGLDGPHQPNLVLVFHDLLLDQDAQGQALADSGGRFVVCNIPAAKPDTGEHGLLHFRMFTGGAIPGRYRDARAARVRHEEHSVGAGAAATITQSYQVDVAAGGTIELRLSYQRGPLLRLVADRPNLPIWTTADPGIVRVYQEDSVVEIVRNEAAGLNLAQELLFRSTVPELADLFDGRERLLAILSYPYYARTVFSPRTEDVGQTHES